MTNIGSVLVTGGLGFIGRHLTATLINKGYTVRVLDIGNITTGKEQKVEVLNGSILDEQMVLQALDGISVVYHLAGIPHLWQQDPSAYHRVNVEGTRNVIQCAIKSGVTRFIHTSSETALKGWKDRSSKPVDEQTSLPKLQELPGPYSRSKLEADLLILNAIKDGFPGMILYPTTPIGPGDQNLTPPTRMILDFLSGKNPAYLECSLNFVPVKAVAEGLVAAAEKGSIGERYILGQENLMMSRFLQMLEQISGKKMPSRRVNYQMALLTAKAMELTARLTGRIPSASIEGVRLAGASPIFDCSKVHKELGLSGYSIEQALEETISWLLNKYIRS